MAFITNTSYFTSNLMISGAGSYDTTTVPTLSTILYAPDGAEVDYFGYSVAVSKKIVVVGAFQDDDNGSNSGSIYLFNVDGTYITKLKPSDGAASDNFGGSVDIGCGRIVAGSHGADYDGYTNAGAFYIFDLYGTQLKKVKMPSPATGGFFGFRVAIGCNRIIASDYTTGGKVHLFDIDGNLIKTITAYDAASGDVFGSSIAINNNRIVIGAGGDDDNGSNSGSAYIYDIYGNFIKKITAINGGVDSNYTNDFFGGTYGTFPPRGKSVTIGDGIIAVASANDNYGTGSVNIFDINGNTISSVTGLNLSFLSIGDRFGTGMSISDGRLVCGTYNYSNGRIVILSLPNSNGYYYVGNVIPSNTSSYENFGHEVDSDEGYIVVGAPNKRNIANTANTGAVYVYTTPYQKQLLNIAD